jgi:hypothetical protein
MNGMSALQIIFLQKKQENNLQGAKYSRKPSGEFGRSLVKITAP